MTYEDHERSIRSAMEQLNRALIIAGRDGLMADVSSKVMSKYGDHDRTVVSITIKKGVLE